MPDAIGGKPRRQKVPVILQQESAECGLACLAMVAAYHGKSVALDELRKLRGLSCHGATLSDLLHTAKHLQLTAWPLRVALSELHRLRLPAVVHWRMNHFVVLLRCGRRRYLIHDPATGRRKVGRREFDESFTGVALELLPARGFRGQSERSTLSFADFAGSFRHLYRYLGLMFCLLLSTQVLALAPPIATQILIDELVLGQDRAWLYRALGGLALIMLTGVSDQIGVSFSTSDMYDFLGCEPDLFLEKAIDPEYLGKVTASLTGHRQREDLEVRADLRRGVRRGCVVIADRRPQHVGA